MGENFHLHILKSTVLYRKLLTDRMMSLTTWKRCTPMKTQPTKALRLPPALGKKEQIFWEVSNNYIEKEPYQLNFLLNTFWKTAFNILLHANIHHVRVNMNRNKCSFVHFLIRGIRKCFNIMMPGNTFSTPEKEWAEIQDT